MAAAGQRRRSRDVPGKEEEMMNFDYDMPVIINVKPEDQLELTAEELEKEVKCW